MLPFHASFVTELLLLFAHFEKSSTPSLHIVTDVIDERLLNTHFILIIFAGLLLLCSSHAFHLSLLEDYCFISSGVF